MNYYEEKISQINFMPGKPWNIDNDNKEEFGILLSAPSCYVRRWNLNYMEIDHADIDEITSLLKAAHLTNKDSLMKDFENALSRGAGAHYEDFEAFWKGSPCFDISELGQRGLNVFICCKEFAEQFKNIVGNRGFCAWDYAEEISIIRMGLLLTYI